MALPGKKKIAILGGGVAGLTAAYELTRTPELRDQHDVTVYQLGWRLGGKAASGRDAWGRNLEHGLHVWFGCYANVFRLVQEVYAQRTPPPGCPLQTWQDVAKPQLYTPIGVRTEEGWTYFPMTWPTNGGVPGVGGMDLTPVEAFETMCGLVWEVLRSLFERLVTHFPPERHPGIALLLTETSLQLVRIAVAGVEDRVTHLRRLQSSFARLEPLVRGADPDASFAVELQLVEELLDITVAGTTGFLTDVWLPDRPLESIDDLDFRAWLIKHGGDPRIVAESSVTRIVYDTLFQYEEGDVERPSYAAGTGLGVIMRLLGTYKGSMMWDIQTGMGEAVIAPLYEALVEAGVAFEFFRKVTRLELGDDGAAVSAVHLERQADTVDGAYRPTFLLESEHLVCWPSEPDWGQLRNGAEMKAAGVDFESHWCDWPAADTEELRRGEDFDVVVLAISMGAYKPLNDEPTMCDALRRRERPVRRLRRHHRDRADQGPAAVVEPDDGRAGLDQRQARHGLRSGVPGHLGRHDAGAGGGAGRGLPQAGVPALPVRHLQDGVLPGAQHGDRHTGCGAGRSAGLDDRLAEPDVALAVAGRPVPGRHLPLGGADRLRRLRARPAPAGVDLLDQQFLRANIDPTECCVQSAAGTTKFRLHPHESGFDNLILAGEATRNGFNTSAIEAAAMSGMAASRAICGQPAEIVGYDFLQRPARTGWGSRP